MRIESARPCGNGGWLHALNAAPQKPLPTWKPLPPPIDTARMMIEWRERTRPEWIDAHAAELGVAPSALDSLGIAWAAVHEAWAFPMFDDSARAIGVRLRKASGAKFAVKGSRQGIFIPAIPAKRTLYICEGPTDTAAALTLGLFAVGRPACLGCEKMIAEFIARHRVRDVVIVADADAPGQRGADKLKAALPVPTKIWTPAAKDLREAVCGGLTAPMIAALVKDIES